MILVYISCDLRDVHLYVKSPLPTDSDPPLLKLITYHFRV